MRAIVLIGHGSLRGGSGASMIRLAARLREAGVAPLTAAGFLNYSRPSFGEALGSVVARGAREVAVQPYFLVPGKFVGVDVPRAVAAAQGQHPAIRVALAPPLGDHLALSELLVKRARAACPPAAGVRDGLLVVAHGSPDPSANRPVYAVAGRIGRQHGFAAVMVGFLGLNEPLIGPALDRIVADGMQRIVVAPYFLQLGGHVADDLPAAVAEARTRHRRAPIVLSEHLGYDPLLAAVIADRVAGAFAGAALPSPRSEASAEPR